MRLLVVCQYYYPEQFRVTDICTHLFKMGHDVTVLTGLPNYPSGKIFRGYNWCDLEKDQLLNVGTENIHGVKILRCNSKPRNVGKKNLVRSYLSFAYQGSKVAKKLPTSDFDKIIVVQFSPVTMAIPAISYQKLVKKCTGKVLPLYLYCFDLWPDSIAAAGISLRGLIYFFTKILSKYIYQQASVIWISSEQFKLYFRNKLHLTQPIEYLPTYAESVFDNTKKSTTKAGINFLFAGNIGEMQSIETILKAAEKVQRENSELNIKFHIVGDGSAYESCMVLAKKLHLANTFFHGRKTLEEMPTLYSMADAFLLTLKENHFISLTLPGKVQSYMAVGKPIVAAIDGEASAVIKKAKCGLVGPSEDFESLYLNIIKFVREKEKHQIYGANSKLYYEEHFSSEAFYKKLSELLIYPK